MWPGVNPESADKVDHNYIAGIKSMIAIAAEQGIYTMIDPHQDEMNPRFCGEGSHWRDCYFADALSPSLLKHLLKRDGGAAE